MDPTLRPAKMRVSRAGEHIGALEAIAAELEAANPQALSMMVDATSLEPGAEVTGAVIDWSQAEDVAPTFRVSILAGEVIYHLRTALEYLVYELAWLDSGSESPRTQFPIEDDERTFWEMRRGTWLRGVSDPHVTQIADFQPFNGCQWSGVLRDLSNRDKHRMLVDVPRQFEGEFTLDPGAAESVPDRPDKVRIPIRLQSARFVIVDLGRPVVEVVTELAVGVSRVLLAFQEDFGEHDSLTYRGIS